MATMNISLPQPMKDWVESRTEDGRYANASDYVRDLIRRDQIKQEKIANLNRLIEEGEASGYTDRTVEDVFSEAREVAARRRLKAS